MADYVGSELKLTMMAFVMKAVAQAAASCTRMINASLDLENEPGHLQGLREPRRGGRYRARAGRAGDARGRPD